MRRRPFSLLVLIGIASYSTPLEASQAADPESGGAAFLLLPVGARAAALGQAAAADFGTSESAFWNPAGLSRIRKAEAAVHFASTFISDNTALSGYLNLSRIGVLGIAGYLVDFGTQDVVGGSGVPIGRLSPKNIELLASFATAIAGNLSMGLNYKLIQFRQDCSGQCGNIPSATGTTHGFDLGLQYGFGSTEAFRVGAIVRHAGLKLQIQNQGQADPLPTRWHIGAIYRVFLPLQTELPQQFDARFLLDIDEEWGSFTSPDARIGMEFGYGEAIRLRGGYAFLDSESRGPSVGLGLRIGNVAVDLARVFFVSSNFDEPLHISVRAVL